MKQRFIVELESSPMDEDYELEELGWYLEQGIPEHYPNVTVKVVSAMANTEQEADREWANQWHKDNCEGQEYCQASGSFQSEHPCEYAGKDEPVEDHGISLSSYG